MGVGCGCPLEWSEVWALVRKSLLMGGIHLRLGCSGAVESPCLGVTGALMVWMCEGCWEEGLAG